MQLNDKVQHVYLVGAKSLGAYGGYETFVYKLTEYHQNKENIKYHVACKANGDGCMDESKFEGVTKINDHEFELHNAHCFKIDVPQIGPVQAIYYDVAALKTCCEHARNAKIRHTERNRTIEDLLNIVTEFINEFKAKFGEHVHVLDWALHLDESTPHIHERHVFDCENKYGEVAPQQEKALEALGFELPDPDKPLSRRNNRKITFDAACRKMLFEIAKRHGLELEEEAEYGNRKYLEKQDFILAKQKEQLAAQQDRLDELTLKVSDMETLLEDVSAAAYDKAVEVVTDVVRTETRKEDMRMIEDTKKWVLSPERKAPQATREYAAHRLDTVLDKFLKTMQTTTARLQEKLLKPEVRQKGKEQVKEKARDSVLQLLNRLQAEQGQNKPTAQPRKQEGHSEI